jgi:hypothetical protein
VRRGSKDRLSPGAREIEAAIGAYNDADPDMLLPLEAVQLLTAMFPRGDVCQHSLAHLTAALGDRMKRVTRLLRLLMEAGFLSKEESLGRVANVYRLHLPPVRR